MDEKIKKIGIPFAIIFIILIIVFIVYKYYNRNTWKIGANVLSIDRIDTSSPKVIPDCEVVRPLDFANYSIDFKIFIDNIHENHTFWRHIFHKGTYVNLVETINHKFVDQSEKNNGWNDLVKKYNEQSLGVWLHPNKNTLRICLTTRVDLKERGDYDKNDHPLAGNYRPIGKYDKEMLIDYVDQIEYCDIENIPVRKISQITLTLEKNMLSIYLNKVLRKVCTFEGAPIYNSRPLFFVHQRSFDGYLQDFRMIPYFIKDNQVAKL